MHHNAENILTKVSPKISVDAFQYPLVIPKIRHIGFKPVPVHNSER